MGVKKVIRSLDLFGKDADFKFKTKSIVGGFSAICLFVSILAYFCYLLQKRLTEPYFWTKDTFDQALAATGQNIVFPFQDGKLQISTEITGERNRAA